MLFSLYNPVYAETTIIQDNIIQETVNLTNDNTNNYLQYATGIKNENGISIKDTIYQNNKIDITINRLDSTFNYANISSGAVINTGTISELIADFIGNDTSVTTTGQKNGSTLVSGGALYNSGNIELINGTFSDNRVYSESTIHGAGGAIYNNYYGSISTIKGTFKNNSVETGYVAEGGAIANSGTITNIEGVFEGNFVKSSDNAFGGAIYNTGTLYSRQLADGSEVISQEVLKLEVVDENGNVTATYYGLANPNDSENAADFENVKISSFEEIPMQVTEEELQEIIGEAESAGMIITQDTPEIIYKDYMLNDTDQIVYNGIVNSSFINNHAETTGTGSNYASAYGGAIYSDEPIIIIAKDNKTSLFQGNYIIDSEGNRRDEAIFMNGAPLRLHAISGGKIRIEDIITGTSICGPVSTYDISCEPKNNFRLNLSGDSTGSIIINNNIESYKFDDGSIEAADIYLDDTNLYLEKREDVFDNNNLFLNSGFMSLVNGSVGQMSLNQFTVNGDTKLALDVDLANKEMDRITAKEYGEHKGNLIVTGMNLISDAPENREVTEIYFAEPELKNNVKNGITMAPVPDFQNTEVYTPIYKYKIEYDNVNQYDDKGDGGYFLFTKAGANTGNPSDSFNPAVLATPVANNAAGNAAMTEAFKYVFEHADAFTNLPRQERIAIIDRNKYAINSADEMNFSPINSDLHNKGAWVRPYTTIESMNLHNGPKVDTITYGTLIGFDGDFKERKNGWDSLFSGYVGYMGASMDYSNVDSSMNGGLAGVTETFYKGNFWTAVTASAGAAVGETSTMYGKEDYTTLLAGIGSKTGYNFEFKEGKFIIQPIMFLSYTFVNTFDYTNAAGVKIKSDPMHTVQINPSVKFIANLKNGWQPYASAGVIWNLLGKSDVRANNIQLPGMRVKPYVEYGLGVQKRWDETYTGFVQAMVRNGGRNGIAFTAGLRRALGNDSKGREKHLIKQDNL